MRVRFAQFSAAALFAAPLLMTVVSLEAPVNAQGSTGLIKESVNEAHLRTLPGNTRPETRTHTDLGRVEDDTSLEHMLLQLQRPGERASALAQYIDAAHDSSSPYYHKWLSAAEIGETYGPSGQDIATITAWLHSHGFTVNGVSASRMQIDFSGTARQVRETFHTEIHALESGGVTHIANMSDPQIPAALAPAVAGVVSLHSFRPRTMVRKRSDYTFTLQGQTYRTLVPADLATIYNLTPLFALGLTGKGQTIAVLEDTDLYASSDWTTFRNAFGLSQYSSGSLSTVHPAPASGKNNCAAPGVARGASAGDDGEAILDAEWASAAAPGASIEVAACASTQTTFGGFIALQNLLSRATPPAIVSVSYGECEAENGATANQAINSLYQQAVAQGISIFVAAGDEAAASCDAGASYATHGIGVSAYASTPYNVAVGGTDFSDVLDGTSGNYWSATNTSTYGSAKSYIPEIPWNDSCASSLLAGYYGYAVGYGSSGFCNSRLAAQGGYLGVIGGGGGPSGCAAGTPSSAGIVGGTCSGYAKPSWQAGPKGIASDGVRDIPDVSLFAADGVWGHFYAYCWSNVRSGGARCSGAPGSWSGAGGTSFASPVMAGIQALVNQSTGSPQGNPNYIYYRLASNPNYTCNSAGGDTGNCIFHNLSRGDIAVNCLGTADCFGSSTGRTRGGPGGGPGGPPGFSGAQGALSTSTTVYSPAYAAATGWNFAVGNGSVNAYNLVTLWSHGN
jgi:subtilase family serine protease